MNLYLHITSFVGVGFLLSVVGVFTYIVIKLRSAHAAYILGGVLILIAKNSLSVAVALSGVGHYVAVRSCGCAAVAPLEEEQNTCRRTHDVSN